MLKFGAKLIFAIMTSVLLYSCSESPKTEEEYLKAAKTLYDSAVSQNDNKMFEESIKMYRDFLTVFPNSKNAPFVYNQIAGIYFENLKNYTEAIKTYTEISEKFADSKDAKQALFMVAFIYDETLKDKENAKIAYKKFLEKYPVDIDPNEKFSESAKVMLQSLESGVSIEEMILKNQPKEKKEEIKKDKDTQSGENEPIQEIKKPVKTNRVDDGTADDKDAK